MIVYEAADLIWATRIKSTADQLGIPCRPVRSVEMLEARLADSDVQAMIIDLDNPEVGLELIRTVRERESTTNGTRIRVLAFGPHVAKQLFQEARDAGADEVLPRGAFDRSLPDILLALGSQSSN
jgi:CheY-like chemotaxis protein